MRLGTICFLFYEINQVRSIIKIIVIDWSRLPEPFTRDMKFVLNTIRRTFLGLSGNNALRAAFSSTNFRASVFLIDNNNNNGIQRNLTCTLFECFG